MIIEVGDKLSIDSA